MLNLGVVRPGSTIRIPFSSFDKDDGSSLTATNYAVGDILCYKDGSTTERASTNGFTATTDFDSKTGKHLAIIDLADNTTAGFWAAGSEYLIAIDAITVDTVTVGAWVARFIIGYEDAIINTTIATLSSQTSFTLTAGPAEDDALNGCIVCIHDVASAVQCGFAVVQDYTGASKTVTLVAGTTFTAAASDNISVFPPALLPTTLGRTLDVASTGTAGVDWGNVDNPTTTVGLSGTTVKTATDVETDTQDIQGRLPAALSSGNMKCDVLALSGDTTAADNAESFFDGTGYAGTNNVIPTVTTVTNQLTAAQIATGVWQDTTAGDFTVASSIGKCLYIANIVPGASGGHFIAGSNAATTVNITGNITGNLSGSVGSLTTNNDKTGYSLSSTQTFDNTGTWTGTVTTVTTVTNQLTAAQIATGVWQDATAGDFTTASSIGKALYIANVAPGGSGGHMISGSNSGTTTLAALTVTGATTLTGAVTGTNASNDLRVNTTMLGGSATPVTNMGIVFNTDFATNYNTTLDMWNVNVEQWNATDAATAIVNANAVQIGNETASAGGEVNFDLIANLDAAITSRMATYTQPTGFLAATFPTTVASTTNITAASGVRLSATGVDDIWDEVQSGHTTAGTFGKYLDAQVSTVGGGTAAQIADAVWDEVLSGHLTTGSTGAALNAAGSAGDPWSTSLPGSYTGTQAGFKFGTLFATALNILHPYVGQDSSLELVIGDSYYAADNRNIQFTYGASPSLSGATVYLDIQTDTGSAFDDDNMTSTTGSASGTVTQLVTFDVPSTTTDDFEEGWRAYRVRAVLSNSHTVTLTRGRLNMLSRGLDAP